MNRYVGTNLKGFTPSCLPTQTERVRILFLNLASLGWSVVANNLPQFTTDRDDIEAVHVRYETRLFPRLRIHGLPLGGRFLIRPADLGLAHAPTVRRWMNRSLPWQRFDVIHCTTQHIGLAAAELKNGANFGLAMMLDVTGTLWQRQMGQPQPVHQPDAFLYQKADLLMPVSQWAGRSLVEDYEVDPARISVVPPPIPWHADPPSKRPVIDSRLSRIVFVGNDFVRKGGDRLLRWHQQHWRDRAELHIVSAKAVPDLSARNVIWHGSVPHQKLLREVLPDMDLFVMPTRLDSLGFVYIESAMAGLPAIGSDTGGASDIIVDGVTGFCLPPDDDAAFITAIERLLDDPNRCRSMGKQAYLSAVARYSEQQMQRALIDPLVKLGRSIRAGTR